MTLDIGNPDTPNNHLVADGIFLVEIQALIGSQFLKGRKWTAAAMAAIAAAATVAVAVAVATFGFVAF